MSDGGGDLQTWFAGLSDDELTDWAMAAENVLHQVRVPKGMSLEQAITDHRAGIQRMVDILTALPWTPGRHRVIADLSLELRD